MCLQYYTNTISGGTVNIGNGTITASIGTISTITSLTNGTVRVSGGTIRVSGGTVNLINGTIKVNLVDRTFTEKYQNITTVTAATPTYSPLIDISKYQDTSWYVLNTTASEVVTVRLAVTPSNNTAVYPLVLIADTATVKSTPVAMTNSNYMKYIAARFTTATTTSQSLIIVFNGRY